MKAGRTRWLQNQHDYSMPLSKLEKVWTGSYLILRDYADGLFPPRFEDQQVAYQNEIAYHGSLPGVAHAASVDADRRKPFWNAAALQQYMPQFLRVVAAIEQAGVPAGGRILELGCGSGWMSEMLAVLGYRVCGTSLAPDDIEVAERRVAALAAKGVVAELQFRLAPMESVHEALGAEAGFDAAFVFEALHHAFDWQAAIASAARCLRPGGVLLICNEPNLLHTCVSYRVARLSNTHEIGMSRSALVRQLRMSGFRRIEILHNRLGFSMRPHWIAAQLPGGAA